MQIIHCGVFALMPLLGQQYAVFLDKDAIFQICRHPVDVVLRQFKQASRFNVSQVSQGYTLASRSLCFFYIIPVGKNELCLVHLLSFYRLQKLLFPRVAKWTDWHCLQIGTSPSHLLPTGPRGAISVSVGKNNQSVWISRC